MDNQFTVELTTVPSSFYPFIGPLEQCTQPMNRSCIPAAAGCTFLVDMPGIGYDEARNVRD
ncbi:hypothetical protein H0178_41175 [Cytobacillus firmus]|nr:hypothetical protein [Cytobacillus firmus]